MTKDPNRRRTAAALKASLDDRLRLDASERSIDVNRLRRQVAFERILVRLDESWILKGGLALEFRLANQCRATRDIDLALAAELDDGAFVRSQLIDLLSDDSDGDHFVFKVGMPRALTADLAGRPGWRFPIDAQLAGKTFVSVRLDVVVRADEIAEAIEPLTIRSTLAFAGYSPTITVPTIDLHQHAPRSSMP